MNQSEKEIEIQKIAELYNIRYNNLGRNIKTVGWGNEKDQVLRFEMLLRGLDPKGKTILDIGCGLGDLVTYLHEKTNGDFQYIGIDIADTLVNDAKNFFTTSNIQFFTCDIFSMDSMPSVDISVMSGALSFKTDGIESYAFKTMHKMFEISNEGASLNFLTKYIDFELPKNQHYSPELVFSKAKELTKKVNLFHDYELYEFTIQLLK